MPASSSATPTAFVATHVCQVLLKLYLLLRRGIRGVGRLDGGIHAWK
jgi:hypothetical protein